jgi:hypothetical protein
MMKPGNKNKIPMLLNPKLVPSQARNVIDAERKQFRNMYEKMVL